MFSRGDQTRLERFGFKFGKGGAHAARTMMLPELRRLLEVTEAGASIVAYRTAVIDDNALDKPTLNARKLSFRHLIELYALNPEVCLFRVFRGLWDHDPLGRPVLCVQMALSRDALLRRSLPLILQTPPGQRLERQRMEDVLTDSDAERFTPTSVEAMAQRLNGTWTQAGYLTGRVKKLRAEPQVAPANLAFALFLAYLEGRLAQRLFTSDWVRVLDLPEDRLIELAQAAAQRGLLVFRRTGAVMEVRFPGYLTEQEQEWLNEQA